MSDPNVITRFAPSPTGALHVGGARTALFSWAFARGQGGKFLLRMEDTDQARSSDQSARGILEDLRWLGMDWDGGEPARQSDRLKLYDAQVKHLLDAGRAREEEGGAVRFQMDRDISFEDSVYGPIEVKAEDLEDFIIRKSDGFPTFHLAVVVDDADMGVTHVIRGQEHLTNTSKHVALQEALELKRPIYAHTPSILNPDGSKMSKRDKAKVARTAARERPDVEALVQECVEMAGIHSDSTPFTADDIRQFMDKKNDRVDIAECLAHVMGTDLPEIDVSDFRRSGFLPEALCNYIALLGWNPGGDVERFDRNFFVGNFRLERIGKSNARFDREKLFRFNADLIAGLEAETFQDLMRRHLDDFHPGFVETLGDRFEIFAESYQPRARTLDEPARIGRFFVEANAAIRFDPKAVKKVLAKNDGEGYSILQELLEMLKRVEPWSGEAAHEQIQKLAEQKDLKMGKIAQPLRVAITGSTVSPSIDQTLQILGKESTLERIQCCLAQKGESDSTKD